MKDNVYDKIEIKNTVIICSMADKYLGTHAVPINNIVAFRVDINSFYLFIETKFDSIGLQLESNEINKVLQKLNVNVNVDLEHNIQHGWIISKRSFHPSISAINIKLIDTFSYEPDHINISLIDFEDKDLEHNEDMDEHDLSFIKNEVYQFKTPEESKKFFDRLIEEFNK